MSDQQKLGRNTEHPAVMLDRLLQEKHNWLLDNERLRFQLSRANRIIGWMMPYTGRMCPPANGLFDLNEHCFENKIPEPAGNEISGAPIDQVAQGR